MRTSRLHLPVITLLLAGVTIGLPDKSSGSEAKKNAKQCTPLSGPAFAAVLKVGDRVVRGEDWDWDDQDGGAGHEGRIIDTDPGWATVIWDAGQRNAYQMGHDGKYDLKLACTSTQTETK